MSEIKIVLAKIHEQQQGDPDIQRELRDVQAFFDNHSFPFEKETIYFVILRGLYFHIERKLRVIGAFVNKMNKPIDGFKAVLEFGLKDTDTANFADLELELPPDFLGRLDQNEGFILHMNVPVEGLDASKEIYHANELTGLIKDLEIMRLNQDN